MVRRPLVSSCLLTVAPLVGLTFAATLAASRSVVSSAAEIPDEARVRSSEGQQALAFLLGPETLLRESAATLAAVLLTTLG